MKKTRLLWSVLILSMLVSVLVSCKNSSDGTDNTLKPADDNVIYSPYVNTSLVLGEGVYEGDVSAVRRAYYRRVGKEIELSFLTSETSHQIIIGKNDSELSQRAYRYLSRFKDVDSYIGYVIYSDGKSAAIAFDERSFGENVALNEAIERFVSEYMKDSSLKLGQGAVYADSFDPIEKQNERDEAGINRLWELKLSQLSANTGDQETADEIIKELKSLYNIFNNNYNTVSWMANLYDPEIGGFYYSNSARNNQGYLPDLESTSQALSIVEAILIGYGGTLTDYFGEEIAAKFVSFAKDMQDETGYFYHPQWSRELLDKNLERKDIDLYNALNILKSFDASPLYDTPNGIVGEGSAAPVSRLATPLCESTACAVSRVTSEDESEIYIPAHMKSKAAFESYLSSLNIRNNTIEVCKKLNSELSLCAAVDEILEASGERWSLCALIESYISRNQNKDTGLWCSANEVTYAEIGELPEIVKLYNSLGKSINYYDTVISTVLSSMKFDEKTVDITDMSKSWSALAAVVQNITAYGEKDIQDAITATLGEFYSDIDVVIKSTKEALLLFLQDDGSFSTTAEGSAYESYGMPVAVPATKEGDMNATALAINNIWHSVFLVLRIGDVPIFNTSDRMMFQKTLLDMGIIIKNEVKRAKPIDFESYEVGDTPDLRWIESTDYKYTGKMEIVAGSYDYGNVLNLYSTGGSDQFHFDFENKTKGTTCFTAELDMCVLPETSSGISSYIYLCNDIYLIALERQGDTIRFIERSSRWDNSYIRDLGISAEVGEWFNIRVEYYPGTKDTVRAKVFFNGECIAVTDTFAQKHQETGVPGSEYTSFAIYGSGAKVMDLLIDNVSAESSYQAYAPENSSSLNMNVDAPDRSQKIRDFESTTAGELPSEFIINGDASYAFVKTDADNNKVLSVSEKAGEIILPLDARGSGANSAVIEFDVTVDSTAKAGAIYQISFNEYLYKERNFGAMRLIVSEENGYKYLTLAEVVSEQTGAVYEDVKLSLGVKYHLSFRLFFEEAVMVVSIDGEIVGISTNVIDLCHRYYMGKTAIKSITPNIPSTIYIDNLVSERVAGSLEEVTTPAIDREICDFDTTENLELSGVTPSGGVLSFENAVGAEAYIKIPVNYRAEYPTMALVGLDISAAESTTGSVILSLSDRSAGIILAIELVRTSSGISIFEYTDNGRYALPICEVSDDSFDLSLEYSFSQKSFYILIDGKYTAASSLIYTPQSGEYSFDHLTITTHGGAGLLIDNLYAEAMCGIFKENKLPTVNTDSEAEVITYENSSFASLPTIIERYVGVPTTYFRISEAAIGEKVTKVLEFYAGYGSTGNSVHINRTQTLNNSNAAFFETDIMLRSTSTYITNVEFNIRSSDGNTPVYKFYLQMSGSDSLLKALGASTTAAGQDFAVSLDVTEGEWFRLRLEYADTPYDFDYDGDNDCYFKAYINGTLIGEGHNNVYEKPQPASTVNKIIIGIESRREGLICLDDTALGGCNMTYDKPIEADTDTLTYSPGVITDKTQFTFGKNTSTANISDMTVNGEVSKVLNFHTANGSSDKLSVSPTLTLDGANAVMFETDIMIEPLSDTATFWLEPQTSAGKQPLRLIIKAAKGGDVTISSADIPETVIGKSGAWIHLKVEYMSPLVDYNGDRRMDILYKIYLDNSSEPFLIGHQPYSQSSYYDPLTITKYVLTVPMEASADIFLDNTRFWQMELIPDEAPEFDYSEEGSIDGDFGFDSGGWS